MRSSITNVAVDRVLEVLLSFGFQDFVRIGSVKKIAKAVLPYRYVRHIALKLGLSGAAETLCLNAAFDGG